MKYSIEILFLNHFQYYWVLLVRKRGLKAGKPLKKLAQLTMYLSNSSLYYHFWTLIIKCDVFWNRDDKVFSDRYFLDKKHFLIEQLNSGYNRSDVSEYLHLVCWDLTVVYLTRIYLQHLGSQLRQGISVSSSAWAERWLKLLKTQPAPIQGKQQINYEFIFSTKVTK